jgi:hypothetical protein
MTERACFEQRPIRYRSVISVLKNPLCRLSPG